MSVPASAVKLLHLFHTMGSSSFEEKRAVASVLLSEDTSTPACFFPLTDINYQTRCSIRHCDCASFLYVKDIAMVEVTLKA